MASFHDLQLIADDLPSGIRRAITLTPTSRGKIVGTSDCMRAALDTILRVAASMCTVLVTGESGTGKELLVAALHDASPRGTGALVAVNCGAIPETLIEAELFGHARGAFTGAHAARQGKVAAAEGGTLFLDEIGELPLAMQVKLLRVLQQREYSPVGDARTLKCDVRIVAATNRDLEAEVAAGRFREDLYYRLNVVHVHLPALRERREDIRALVQHFLRDAIKRGSIRTDRELKGRGGARGARVARLAGQHPRARERHRTRRPLRQRPVDRADRFAQARPRSVGRTKRPAEGRAPAARARHATRHALRRDRAVFSADRARGHHHGPRQLLAAELRRGIDLRAAVEAYENELIRQALERSNWNKQAAARLLGINRTTLVEMVKRKRLTG